MKILDDRAMMIMMIMIDLYLRDAFVKKESVRRRKGLINLSKR